MKLYSIHLAIPGDRPLAVTIPVIGNTQGGAILSAERALRTVAHLAPNVAILSNGAPDLLDSALVGETIPQFVSRLATDHDLSHVVVPTPVARKRQQVASGRRR